MTITTIKGITATATTSTSVLGNLQLVANNCQLYWRVFTGTYTRFENRYPNYIGNANVTNLKAAFPGFYQNQVGTGETTIGNDYNAQTAFEIISPSMYAQPYYSGVSAGPVVTVPDGISIRISDTAAPIMVSAGTEIYCRTGLTIATSAQNMPSNSGTKVVLYSAPGYQSNAASSQVPATGAMTNPGASNLANGVSPMMILGIPDRALPAVLSQGDSITVGQGEGAGQYDSFSSAGWIGRGLNLVTPYPIPWTNYGAPSNKLSADATMSTGYRKRASWPFVTHLIFGLGSNDISAAATLAAVQANAILILQAAKATIGPYGKPPKTYWALIVPRTTSTDSWATAVNQTPVAGYELNGVRDQFNAWLPTIVGQGLLDGVIDVATPCQDPSNKSLWVTTGAANYPTTDGTHPTTALNILMAAVLTPIAQNFTT